MKKILGVIIALTVLVALMIPVAGPVAAASSMTVVSDTSVQITGVYNKAGGVNNFVDLSGNLLNAVRAQEPDPYSSTYVTEPPEATDSTWDEGLESWFEINSTADWIWETERAEGLAGYDPANPLYDADASTNGRVVVFEKTFDINGSPLGGELYIAADNCWEVRINGTFLARSSTAKVAGWETSNLYEAYVASTGWNTISIGPITVPAELLIDGENTITVLAGNEQYDNTSPYESNNSSQPVLQSSPYRQLNPGAVIFKLDVSFDETQVQELYGVCGYKYDTEGVGLADWTIILEKSDGTGGWIPYDSTTTGADGKYCFCELPEGDYRVSETLQEGWEQISPAGGYYYVTLPGDSAFYGIGRTAAKNVYEIDPLTGAGTLIVSLSSYVSNPDISGPNGLAYDPANDLLYFTTYPGDAVLYSYDLNTATFSTLGLLSDYLTSEELIQIAAADFYNGKYYFINGGSGNFTDDLYEVTFNTNGTIAAVTKLADISGNAARWGFWGDIGIKDGVIYGYGMNQVSPAQYEFFKVNSDGTGFAYIKDPAYSFSLQLAFGADGLLYGYDLGGADYYTIDLLDGSLTPKAQNATILGFNDMASGRMNYNFVNEAMPAPQEVLSVTKTAETSYTRTYLWDIDKSVETEGGWFENDLPKIWLYTDGSGDETATWTVDVTYLGNEDSDWNVSGTITIENPGEVDAIISDITDELAGTAISVVWDTEVIFPFTLAAGETLTGTYDEGVASAITGINEVTVTTSMDLYSGSANIVWGDPTTEVNKTVTIEDVSDLFGTVNLGTVTAPDNAKFTYTKDFAWADYDNLGPSADYTYNNTATIVETQQSASATLKVNVQGYYYETAYAKGGDGVWNTFIPTFSNWGWTNGPIGPGTYTWDLWAAAGQNDTSKGILVGTVTVTYGADGSFDFEINLTDDFVLDESHVYAGTTMFPQVQKKTGPVSTVAPGQYYIQSGLTGQSIYVIVHAVVGIPDPNFGPPV